MSWCFRPLDEAERGRAIGRSSEIISASRVLCIFFMTYVHVHFVARPELEEARVFAAVRSVFVDLLGRSSVPLLSIISGVLMTQVLRKRGFFETARSRAQTLLVPMITWNLMGLGLAALLGKPPRGAGWDAVLALGHVSFYPHLAFLRDIFVVSLATPWLVLLARRAPWSLLVGSVAFVTFTDLYPVVLRDQIFLYFLAGIYLGVYGLEQALSSKLLRTSIHVGMAVLVVAATILPFAPGLSGLYHDPVFDNLVRRPVCAVWFWLAASTVIRHPAARDLIRKQLEPAIFFMFLSHALVIHLLGSAYARLVPPQLGAAYYAMWFATPVMCLLVAVAACRLLPHLPRPLSWVLVGRARTPHPRPAAVVATQAHPSGPSGSRPLQESPPSSLPPVLAKKAS